MTAEPKTIVYVATYEHRHGTNPRVFTTEAAAWAWRQELAADYWREVFGDDLEMPTDPEEAATRYWDTVNDEYFNIEGCELEA